MIELKIVIYDHWAWWTTEEAELGQSPKGSAAPALLRRRLTSLGRAVVDGAFAFGSCVHDANIPLIFVSRWGDITVAHQLIDQLINEGEVSPQRFAVSVHNGIQGAVSIVAHHTGPETAIAANDNILSAAFQAASAYLVDYSEVLLLIYDDALPWNEATEKNQSDSGSHVIALHIGRAGNDSSDVQSKAILTLNIEPRKGEAATSAEDAEIKNRRDWWQWLTKGMAGSGHSSALEITPDQVCHWSIRA